MCGRFSLTQTGDALATALQLSALPPAALAPLQPRYNIAPGQPIATVVATPEHPSPHLDFHRWGLVPSWAKDPAIGSRLINARAETVVEKPSFRAAFKRRRCLVLADGFYEWETIAGQKTKQPHYIFLKDHRPFAFAGLWEHWSDSASGGELHSCTILTTAPNALMEPIHTRMPVILPPADYAAWLDPSDYNPQALLAMLRPYEAEDMDRYPVSTLVNKPQHDSPDCMAPLEGRKQ